MNADSEDFPKPCPDSEICGVDKDFANKHLLQNHRTLHHDDKWPGDRACNFPDCQLPKEHVFASREAFRRHLTSYHYLNAIQAREYIAKIIPVKFQAPRGVSKSYLKTMCLFPGCKCDTEIGNYSDYTLHLKKSHSLTSEQYPEYMPTMDTVRLHPRPQNIDTTVLVKREFLAGSTCSHEDCSASLQVYDTKDSIDRHLTKSHKIAARDRSKYYTGVETAPFYATQCLHTDCATRGRFFTEQTKYTAHLKAVHKLSTTAEISSHQLWWKLKYGST
jgi:hypothetical protein